MEMIWSGAPPVLSRDKSDGVPDLEKKLFADYHVPVCYRPPLRENGRAPNWVSRSPVSESSFGMYHKKNRCVM